MIRSRLLMCLVFFVLPGCGHLRPALNGDIAISAERLSANLNQDKRTSALGDGTPEPQREQHEFLASVAALQRDRANGREDVCRTLLAKDISGDAARPVEPGHAIVLSGGSQNGAFGAGLLVGLQDKGALPPEATIVTGVSTGSLQATLVFLAREPVPADRRYGWLDRRVSTLASLPGADGEQPLVPGRTNLEDMALAYSITREDQILKPSALGAIDIVFKGALATLEPLRARLMALITPDTIQQVATESCRGRSLLVGVADVDDGNGYALDLTALALSAYDGHATATRMALVRETFVSALLASSSVPVGAMPVTLRYRELDKNGAPVDTARRHLFIDGGARFGVFLPALSDDFEVTLLVNTTLSTDPWIPGNPAAPTDRWKLLDLALRTVTDILETQVYQLSVGRVEAAAKHLKMAYISNAGIRTESGVPPEAPETHLYLGKNCAAWKSEDLESHPIQFDPKYMACLIDYGRSRGNLQQWNLVGPSSAIPAAGKPIAAPLVP